jgi:hypothetical protein
MTACLTSFPGRSQRPPSKSSEQSAAAESTETSPSCSCDEAGAYRYSTGYVNLVDYNLQDDMAVVVVTPFIDYSKLTAHLALLTEVGGEAVRIAGYTWNGRSSR